MVLVSAKHSDGHVRVRLSAQFDRIQGAGLVPTKPSVRLTSAVAALCITDLDGSSKIQETAAMHMFFLANYYSVSSIIINDSAIYGTLL